MSKCYYSDIDIDHSNESVEHVIPRAFGGKLKSKNILTKAANNELGQQIDSKLTKAISLNTVLQIDREGTKNPAIRAKTVDGTRFIYKGGDEAVQAPRKPKIEYDSEGNITAIEFLGGQEKEIIALTQKHFPELSPEEIKEKISYSVNPTKKEIFFENHMSILSSIDEFRGVAKIGINYAIHITDAPQFCMSCIDFLKGTRSDNGFVSYYYPETPCYVPDDDEISHVLHLIGNHADSYLICYIELFNSHKFIVTLNGDYQGPDIENTYIFDILKKEVIEKPITVNVDREFLKMYDHRADTIESKYFDSLEPVLAKRGLTLTRRPIKEVKKQSNGD
jgi:hypothetical protein